MTRWKNKRKGGEKITSENDGTSEIKMRVSYPNGFFRDKDGHYPNNSHNERANKG